MVGTPLEHERDFGGLARVTGRLRSNPIGVLKLSPEMWLGIQVVISSRCLDLFQVSTTSVYPYAVRFRS